MSDLRTHFITVDRPCKEGTVEVFEQPVSASGVPRNGGNTPSPLQALLQDQDLLLILALLILLRAEKADLPLLLAVGYLLL